MIFYFIYSYVYLIVFSCSFLAHPSCSYSSIFSIHPHNGHSSSSSSPNTWTSDIRPSTDPTHLDAVRPVVPVHVHALRPGLVSADSHVLRHLAGVKANFVVLTSPDIASVDGVVSTRSHLICFKSKLLLHNSSYSDPKRTNEIRLVISKTVNFKQYFAWKT